MAGYMHHVLKSYKVPSILHVRKPLTARDIIKFKCRKADYLIAISTRIIENLKDAGISPERIMRIDDSVDIDLFAPVEEKLRPSSQLNIGIIGRIDKFKRQLDFLIAAEEVLKKTGQPLMFFVIGDIHSQPYFKKIKKFIQNAGIEKNVCFTGRRDDIHELIQSLDMLVSLSGGSVMFEAMAAGKAVISAGFSTKKYSYHIQDGKTGILVESRKIEDLSEAILKLVDSPQLRNQLAIHARQWALKELTHTKMAEKTQQLYNEMLK